ncbi:MAG: hypothetical protein WBG86_00695 [Polyangiales bacterium]
MVRGIGLYLVLASIACGPNLAQLHASDASYERCYAADFDPAQSSEARVRCWRDWLAHDAVNQPPERVDFAEERLHQLEAGASTRALPDNEPVPIAEQEHAYPPAAPGSYHTSGCDPLCREKWDACTRHCDADQKACKTACESEFRICTSGCP